MKIINDASIGRDWPVAHGASKNKQTAIISVGVLFFAIDFIREALALINVYTINIISLVLGFILLLLVGKLKIRKELVRFYVLFVIFSFVSIFNGILKGFIDAHTILYSVYKITEITVVLTLASVITKNQLIVFYKKFVSVFFKLHVPLFLYYLLAIAGILGFVDRVVVFSPNRFGGLSGEPAQYGQMIFVVLIYLIELKKNIRVKHFKLKLFLFSLLALSSFSNAFFLPLFVLIGYYAIRKSDSSALKNIVYLSATALFMAGLFFVNERMNIDFEQLWFIVLHAKELKDLSVEGFGLNSITTRFYEVVYSLSLTNELIGNGIGSSKNYPVFSGVAEEGEALNFYGISQLGYELGLIPMFVFMVWMVRLIVKYNGSLLQKSTIISVFVVMLAINGLAFKLYWFLLFTLILNKEPSKKPSRRTRPLNLKPSI